ncbi:SOS response-associated peptidase family protein [Chryseobacterium sp. SIMBA_028]|uniref:SOS response-associated peptidase family protein n=1 Tax=Chryseobacterium sp. SIMBA_028 TaxID=3085771 RepID=UPI0039793BF8
MCYSFNNKKVDLKKIAEELDAENYESDYVQEENVSAFTRPAMPIVLEHNGRKITHGTWGLYTEIPKDKPAKGLNLTAENTHTYYKKFEHNRCVVPISGFYDFQHVSIPGKKTPAKVKHEVLWKNTDHLYLAGFYDVWENNEIGVGIVTTVANELMSIVHNSKMRMPICLDAKMADRFLKDEPIEEFVFPAYDPALVAVNLEPHKLPPPTLF